MESVSTLWPGENRPASRAWRVCHRNRHAWHEARRETITFDPTLWRGHGSWMADDKSLTICGDSIARRSMNYWIGWIERWEEGWKKEMESELEMLTRVKITKQGSCHRGQKGANFPRESKCEFFKNHEKAKRWSLCLPSNLSGEIGGKSYF